jgi:hypothetical protein
MARRLPDQYQPPCDTEIACLEPEIEIVRAPDPDRTRLHALAAALAREAVEAMWRGATGAPARPAPGREFRNDAGP